MIPAKITSSLLKELYNDLITFEGEPDYNRYRVIESIEKRYGAFMDVLIHSENDLSIIVSLLEKDPDCGEFDPVKRLQALVDYVEIACALFEVNKITPKNSTIH